METTVLTNDNAFPGRRALTASCLFVYFVTGIVITGIGPCLPAMGRKFGVSLGAQGLVLTCMFGGNFLAVFAGGVLGDIIGQKRIVCVGSALMGLGAAVVAAAGRWELVLVGFLLVGAGLGCLDVGTNAVVAKINGKLSARYLGLLHAAFGVGAVSGPSVAAIFIVRMHEFYPVFAISAVLSAVSLVWFITLRFPLPGMSDGFDAKALRRALSDPRFMIFATVQFICCGIEMSMNGWTFTYLRTETGASMAVASFGASFFWCGLLAGRLLASAFVTRVGAARLLMMDLVGMALALAAVVMLRSPVSVAILAGVTGLFISSQVPLIVSLASTIAKDAQGSVTGGLFAMGSLGGALLPAAVAQVAERTSLKVGLGAQLPLALIAIPLLLGIRFLKRRAD